MGFNLGYIINKFLPVQVTGNKLKDAVVMHNGSTSSGVGTAIQLDGEGSLLLAVKGSFTAELLVSGQGPDGSWHSLSARKMDDGQVLRKLVSVGLYDVDVRGLSAVRVYISSISSGSVSVYGRVHAIEPYPIDNQYLLKRLTDGEIRFSTREHIYQGSTLSTGQRKITSNTSASQLGTSTTVYKSITIKANESNQGNVVVGGGSSLTNSTGFTLPPGSSTTIIGDFSPSKIWLNAEVVNDGITWMGVL